MSLFLMSKPSHDIIVIGAGPAGLTAGLYAASMGLRALILEGSIPSRLTMAHEIRNYPGFPESISGGELLERMRRQALEMGAEIRRGDALAFSLVGPVKMVTTREETYRAYAVILAVGLRRKRSKIEGEERLLGLGVSYCAICDGPLFKGRRVAVVGYGDEAVEDALLLSGMASRTYFIPLKRLTEEQLERLRGSNIEIMEAEVEAIEGEDYVEALRLRVEGETRRLEVDGVFIVTEAAPLTDILARSGLEVDERGCIKVNRRQETNIEGVYAAGDCTCGGMQVATAVGEGARAAINAVSYVRKMMKTTPLKL